MGMVSFNTVNKLYPSQNIQYYCTYSHVVLLNLNMQAFWHLIILSWFRLWPRIILIQLRNGFNIRTSWENFENLVIQDIYFTRSLSRYFGYDFIKVIFNYYVYYCLGKRCGVVSFQIGSVVQGQVSKTQIPEFYFYPYLD